MLRLNKEQLRVCQHEEGPILVLAAPGSGKTNVICHRLLYLLKEKHVPPESICVMTFTKAAARSMQERFFSLLGHSERVAMGTIHGLCYRILSKHLSRNLQILNEIEKKEFLKAMLHRYRPKLIIDEETVQKVSSRLSYIASHPELSDELYHYYQEEKERLAVMDYDDLVGKAVALLERDAIARKNWQGTFSYYMVDEFQDVNALQLRLLILLAQKRNNVMVVGDDDQAIYGFRGSMPGIFREFETAFPSCAKYFLSINYRSKEEILKKASVLIRHNTVRYEKEITGASGTGGKVMIQKYDTKEDSYRQLLEAVQREEKQLPSGEQIGILFRNGYQIRDFLWFVKKQGITLSGERRREHFLIKDLLGYCRLMEEKVDVSALLQIMNHPDRGITRFFLPKENFCLEEFCKQAIACREPLQAKKMQMLFRELEEAKAFGPALGIIFILKGMGLQAYAEANRQYEGWEEDLTIIKEVSNRTKTWEEFGIELKKMMNEESKENRGRERICVLTMHGAKGLEFHSVFLPELVEEVIPGRKCDTKEQMEEERRVFYVAVTRAKVNLYLSYYGKKASHFIKELQKGVRRIFQ